MKKSELPDTLDDLVNAFGRVYGDIDRKRSVEQMWLQVVEEAASVAEAVREVNYVEVVGHLANTFCWLSGLVAKCRGDPNSILHFEEDFSSIVWRKYPNSCPLCGVSSCQCLIKKREIDSRSPEEKNRVYEKAEKKAQRTIEDRIRNLDRLVNMFEEIFGSSYFVMPIEEITFHFTEEVGEVAEQIRELRAVNIAPIEEREKIERRERITKEFLRELADVFSWMCGILIKVNLLIENVDDVLSEFGRSEGAFRKITFSETLQKYYTDDGRLVCRTCGQSPCDIKEHDKLYQLSE